MGNPIGTPITTSAGNRGRRGDESHSANRTSARYEKRGEASLERLVIGYASGPGRRAVAREELEQQAAVIARECERRRLRLVELVNEREPTNGKALSRPGLAYALERISSGAAAGLIVSELSRITRSAAELGKLIEWLGQAGARLVAAGEALDTDEADGRLAANLLVEIGRWEFARLSERTRNGLEAARRNDRCTGRPTVVDYPALRERIRKMRAAGMTLQAIADQLNEEGIPTVRGGTKWRHSSVQSAAGYHRPSRSTPVAFGASSGGS